ncbi:MAG: hypothetical protein H6734_27350 [Alphaproteobacteria bacterium]|nr:hypothetical protein [Alphaproteobacteria bacterium]
MTVKRNGDVTLRARAVAMGLGVVSAFGVLGGIASWPGGLAVVAVVFGCIGLLVAFQDLRRFARGPLKGRDRIAQHLVSSGAALIATTTAMLVTVGRWLPDAIPGFVWWLLPTVLVTRGFVPQVAHRR